MGVAGSTIDIHPIVPNALRVFDHTWMLQDAGWLRSVLEKGASVFFHGERGAKSVLHHGYRAESHKTVEAQAGNVEDLIALEDDVFVMLTGNFIRIGVIGIEQIAIFRPVDLHVFRKQRIQPQDAVFSVPHDLCVSVTPQ